MKRVARGASLGVPDEGADTVEVLHRRAGARVKLALDALLYGVAYPDGRGVRIAVAPWHYDAVMRALTLAYGGEIPGFIQVGVVEHLASTFAGVILSAPNDTSIVFDGVLRWLPRRGP